MTSLLIKNATILTLNSDDRVVAGGHVAIRDGRIAGVGEGDYRGDIRFDNEIDGTDKLVAPGLVNAHTHSQSSTMAGFGDCLSHPSFMWLTQAHTSRRNAEEIRLSVLLTAHQMLMTGTTATIDHFPGQRFTQDDMDAVLSAWEESGMRAALAMRFFDGEFGDILPNGVVPADAASVGILKPQAVSELRELMGDTIRRWHGRDGRLSVFPAPSNPDRCSDEALLLCADFAQAHDTGIHTHLLETKRQAEIAQQRYGSTTVEHLEKLGVLSDRWSCAHSIWLTDGDIELMAKRRATAVLNPESNSRLGTGTARVLDLMFAGVPLAIGTDGAGANDNLMMHEAMRAVANLNRPNQPDRKKWVRAGDVLRMATSGGAYALRLGDELGRIDVGYLADLTIYRLDNPWWTPINDLTAQLVYAESGSSVETVIVGGRVVLANGRPTLFDAAAVRQGVNEMTKSLRQRNADLFRVAEQISRVTP
jgi:cytosine/adenosine deaminase-related metal-dependent hydrolase